jgi:hypothetical protein
MKDLNANDIEGRRQAACRFRPVHGPGEWWSRAMAKHSKRFRGARGTINREKDYPVSKAEASQEERQRQVRRDDRGRR